MNSEMDPMGRAIADYHKSKKASKLRVFSPMLCLAGYLLIILGILRKR